MIGLPTGQREGRRGVVGQARGAGRGAEGELAVEGGQERDDLLRVLELGAHDHRVRAARPREVVGELVELVRAPLREAGAAADGAQRVRLDEAAGDAREDDVGRRRADLCRGRDAARARAAAAEVDEQALVDRAELVNHRVADLARVGAAEVLRARRDVAGEAVRAAQRVLADAVLEQVASVEVVPVVDLHVDAAAELLLVEGRREDALGLGRLVVLVPMRTMS